jgi:HAD superfamily hydrolase (TIGR01509 family)
VIKLIVFDYDGTLLDCSRLHYEALNEALINVSHSYAVSFEEHVDALDSLTTADKLLWYHENKGLPTNLFQKVKSDKKKRFTKMINEFSTDTPVIKETLEKLKLDGYFLGVASNATKGYVASMLKRQGIYALFDSICTRNDCRNTKPHPEMYMKIMTECGVGPLETLVYEDSLVGHRSAVRSGAHLAVVEDVSDITYESVKKKISGIDARRDTIDGSWFGDNINVVIPMAGAGSRFKRSGFDVPKPLIDVHGMPMVQAAIELIDLPNAKFTFIVQREHDQRYGLTHLLRAIKPGSNIVHVDGLTDGAACTMLVAKQFIDNDEHLVISNCDQRIEMDWAHYFNRIVKNKADASLVCFEETEGSMKWSYAAANKDGWISEVKEKQRISSFATCGIYHFTRGKDFVASAEEMIAANDRVNNEFYVAPTFNYAIKNGKRVMNFMCKRMIGMGTPEDLTKYVEK